MRHVPHGVLAASAARKGLGVRADALVHPSLIASVAYRIDRAWGVDVAFGGSLDGYGFSDGTVLSVSTYALTIGGTRAFDLGLGWLEPFVGGGAGWWFTQTQAIGADGRGTAGEGGASGLYLAAGLRAAFSERYGLVLEDRYIPAAYVAIGDSGAMSVGGNTVNLLFYGIWRG